MMNIIDEPQKFSPLNVLLYMVCVCISLNIAKGEKRKYMCYKQKSTIFEANYVRMCVFVLKKVLNVVAS